jgi:hypothetical protein
MRPSPQSVGNCVSSTARPTLVVHEDVACNPGGTLRLDLLRFGGSFGVAVIALQQPLAFASRLIGVNREPRAGRLSVSIIGPMTRSRTLARKDQRGFVLPDDFGGWLRHRPGNTCPKARGSSSLARRPSDLPAALRPPTARRFPRCRVRHVALLSLAIII